MKKVIIGTIMLWGTLVFGQENAQRYHAFNLRQLPFKKVTEAISKPHIQSKLQTIYTETLDSVTSDSTGFFFMYDESGNMLTYQESELVNASWEGNFKSEMTYDQLGNRLSYIHFSWSNGAWLQSSKYNLSYDGSGKQISQISYTWQNGIWNETSKEEYAYDSSNNKIFKLNYDWRDNAWVQYSKNEYSYNESGKLISDNRYIYSNGAWKNSSKHVYTYDALENMISDTSYSWSNDTWSNSSLTEYTYNGSGNTLCSINYGWRVGAWVQNYKTERTYDGSGNAIVWLDFDWSDGGWIEDEKYYFTFDTSVAASSIAGNLFLEEFEANNKMLSLKSDYQNPTTKRFEFDEIFTFYYSPFTSIAIQPFTNKSLSNQLSLSVSGSHLKLSRSLPTGSSIALFDLSGHKLIEQAVTGNTMALPHLAKGVYVAKVSTGKMVVQQKVSVK